MTHASRVTRIALVMLRVLVSVLVSCGVALWLGLSGMVFIAYGEEGGKPGRSLLRLGAEEVFLLLALVTMAAALRLLWLRDTPRRLWAAILAVAIAQLTILASALGLAHFVRSGLAWQNTAWRRFLSELRLVELFAYYSWVGATALAAAAAVAAVAAVKLFSRQTLL